MLQSVLKILTLFIYVCGFIFLMFLKSLFSGLNVFHEFFKTLPKNTRKALHLDLNSQATKEIFNSYFPL